MMTYEGTEAIPRIPVHERVTATDMSAAGVRVDHLHVAGPLDDVARLPGVDLPGGQEGQGPVGILGGDDREHPDAHVERALHLGLVDPALGADQVEDRLRAPSGPVDDRVQMLGHYP